MYWKGSVSSNPITQIKLTKTSEMELTFPKDIQMDNNLTSLEKKQMFTGKFTFSKVNKTEVEIKSFLNFSAFFSLIKRF